MNACRREPVDRPPVWMMRQAGRYLPEYRAIREKQSTLQMMKNPLVACEITLQPVRRLGVDAAILYSDILIVPEGMGLKLDFVRGEGPTFEEPFRAEEDLKRLEKSVFTRCRFVGETIRLIKKNIPANFPLLGFAGAPFTVGTYMVGGEGAHHGERLKKMADEEPLLFQALMAKVTEGTIDYLLGQVEAGVDAIQLFDTWAGSLSPDEYSRLALPYEQKILKAVRGEKLPTILYIKGGGPLFSRMVGSGADVLGIDWKMSLTEARRLSAGRVAIQGNLDPAVLLKPVSEIETAVEKMIGEWGQGPGYIVNLGHGIRPDAPVAHAQAFIDAAKKFGPRTV